MLPVNMNHLYYFYEIAKRGSFTEAARDLMVSQSSLSIQMKQLERVLGFTLFNRHKNGVDLTDGGEIAYQSAEKIFREVESLLDTLKQAERSVKGNLSVGTVNSIGIYILPTLLKSFKELCPEVKVNIDFKHARDVIEMLQAGRIDVAIITWFKKYSLLKATSLTKSKLFLVSPPDHPLARCDSISPRDLEKFPFIAYEAGTPTRLMMDALFRRMSLDIDYAMESSNVATIKHMVMAGLGIAFLPELAVGFELRQGILKRLDIPSLGMAQEITLYTKANRTLSNTTTAFVEFLKDSLGRKRIVKGKKADT